MGAEVMVVGMGSWGGGDGGGDGVVGVVEVMVVNSW